MNIEKSKDVTTGIRKTTVTIYPSELTTPQLRCLAGILDAEAEIEFPDPKCVPTYLIALATLIQKIIEAQP